MSLNSKELLMFKKLLPILFLFTGFQANAVLIGNLTYDGTYISGDGRTYLRLNTIASWDYATTLAATQVGMQYEGFRIANSADALYFIGSLFGASPHDCSTINTATWTICGDITGWADGLFGISYDPSADYIIFKSEVPGYAGLIWIGNTNQVGLDEAWFDISHMGGLPVSWLLVKDTVVSVPEPSIIALMGLGIFGIGFARRRRQS
jgi:hypothetical protein